MAVADRERSLFIASGLFAGSYLLAFGGLLGLIVTLGLVLVTLWASRTWAADSTSWRTGALALSGLTVVLAAYGSGQYTEWFTVLVSYLFALAYLVNALRLLMPNALRNLPAVSGGRWAAASLLVLTVLLGFLTADFTTSYVLWLCAIWYLWRSVTADGLWSEYAPSQLWATDWRRWMVVGVILSAACLGLAWSQKTDVSPGMFLDFYLNGNIDPIFQFDMSAHSFGVDLLPALLMTALVWWMARPMRGGSSGWHILDRPWLPLAVVAVLVLYALTQGPLAEFGPKAFIVCLIPVGVGAYRYYRRPAEAA